MSDGTVKIKRRIPYREWDDIITDELNTVAKKHGEAWDTEPRDYLYQCAEELKLNPTNRPKNWSMFSAAGNRAMQAANKRVIKRILKLIEATVFAQ